MIPGEVLTAEGEIELNAGRRTLALDVSNTGDRPIQVGSHYHFAETNSALAFDRDAARGMRLNIPAGTAVRFEPGQSRSVELVDFAGERRVFGFNAAVMGPLDAGKRAVGSRAGGTRSVGSRAGGTRAGGTKAGGTKGGGTKAGGTRAGGTRAGSTRAGGTRKARAR